MLRKNEQILNCISFEKCHSHDVLCCPFGGLVGVEVQVDLWLDLQQQLCGRALKYRALSKLWLRAVE